MLNFPKLSFPNKSSAEVLNKSKSALATHKITPYKMTTSDSASKATLVTNDTETTRKAGLKRNVDGVAMRDTASAFSTEIGDHPSSASSSFSLSSASVSVTSTAPVGTVSGVFAAESSDRAAVHTVTPSGPKSTIGVLSSPSSSIDQLAPLEELNPVVSPVFHRTPPSDSFSLQEHQLDGAADTSPSSSQLHAAKDTSDQEALAQCEAMGERIDNLNERLQRAKLCARQGRAKMAVQVAAVVQMQNK